MAYDLIKISALPETTPDDSQDIVIGEGDYAKRIKYADVKADMVGTSPTYTTDTEPYLTRQTAHTGVVGKCALNKLVGGSLGWNQLAHNFTARSATLGITIAVDNTNGSITASGTATATNTLYFMTSLSVIQGHKYLLTGSKGKGTLNIYASSTTKVDSGNGTIYSASASVNNAQLSYGFTSGQTYNETLYPQLRDLTIMFGSTIADYVYGLEQATAGAGVAWLSKYIDLSTYHAYDAGSIQSVQATAHVTKDANDNVIGNYPLGSDTLRGIPQLVSNKLSYDGDEKYPDGTIRRKYGTIDLGTLTWNKHGTYTNCFSATLSGVNAPSPSNICAPCVCARYVAVYGADITLARITSTDSSGCAFLSPSRWSTANPTIVINDVSHTSSTAEQFKTAMSGVYLVFPLTTESTESSTIFQKIQTIDADGTESFTTSSPVPVGHETQTPDNILAALNWLGE